MEENNRGGGGVGLRLQRWWKLSSESLGKIFPEKNSITMWHHVINARAVRSLQADLNELLKRVQSAHLLLHKVGSATVTLNMVGGGWSVTPTEMKNSFIRLIFILVDVQNNKMCAFSTCYQHHLLQMYLTAGIRLGPYHAGIEWR